MVLHRNLQFVCDRSGRFPARQSLPLDEVDEDSIVNGNSRNPLGRTKLETIEVSYEY